MKVKRGVHLRLVAGILVLALANPNFAFGEAAIDYGANAARAGQTASRWGSRAGRAASAGTLILLAADIGQGLSVRSYRKKILERLRAYQKAREDQKEPATKEELILVQQGQQIFDEWVEYCRHGFSNEGHFRSACGFLTGRERTFGEWFRGKYQPIGMEGIDWQRKIAVERLIHRIENKDYDHQLWILVFDQFKENTIGRAVNWLFPSLAGVRERNLRKARERRREGIKQQKFEPASESEIQYPLPPLDEDDEFMEFHRQWLKANKSLLQNEKSSGSQFLDRFRIENSTGGSSRSSGNPGESSKNRKLQEQAAESAKEKLDRRENNVFPMLAHKETLLTLVQDGGRKVAKLVRASEDASIPEAMQHLEFLLNLAIQGGVMTGPLGAQPLGAAIQEVINDQPPQWQEDVRRKLHKSLQTAYDSSQTTAGMRHASATGFLKQYLMYELYAYAMAFYDIHEPQIESMTSEQGAQREKNRILRKVVHRRTLRCLYLGLALRLSPNDARSTTFGFLNLVLQDTIPQQIMERSVSFRPTTDPVTAFHTMIGEIFYDLLHLTSREDILKAAWEMKKELERLTNIYWQLLSSMSQVELVSQIELAQEYLKRLYTLFMQLSLLGFPLVQFPNHVLQISNLPTHLDLLARQWNFMVQELSTTTFPLLMFRYFQLMADTRGQRTIDEDIDAEALPYQLLDDPEYQDAWDDAARKLGQPRITREKNDWQSQLEDHFTDRNSTPPTPRGVLRRVIVGHPHIKAMENLENDLDRHIGFRRASEKLLSGFLHETSGEASRSGMSPELREEVRSLFEEIIKHAAQMHAHFSIGAPLLESHQEAIENLSILSDKMRAKLNSGRDWEIRAFIHQSMLLIEVLHQMVVLRMHSLAARHGVSHEPVSDETQSDISEWKDTLDTLDEIPRAPELEAIRLDLLVEMEEYSYH